ncbi:MAG: YgaP family membrane protein [Bacillota bacterium]
MYVVNGKSSIIRLIVGLLILGSVLLSQFHHPGWLFFTGFVGAMLMISATTGFCPMEIILKSLGVKEKMISEGTHG